MAAAALPLALSPLGGGEGGGDTNNTPPSRLQKKKKRRAQSGGPLAPPALHVRARMPSPGRLALQTFHFLCAERPPPHQAEDARPPFPIYTPPPQLCSPRFLPPLPIPQIRQC